MNSIVSLQHMLLAIPPQKTLVFKVVMWLVFSVWRSTQEHVILEGRTGKIVSTPRSSVLFLSVGGYRLAFPTRPKVAKDADGLQPPGKT